MAPGSRMPVPLSPIIVAPEKPPHDVERAPGGNGEDGEDARSPHQHGSPRQYESPQQYEMRSPYFLVSRPNSALTAGTEAKQRRDDETGACCGIKSRRKRWVATISAVAIVLILAIGIPVIHSSKKDNGSGNQAASQAPSSSHPDNLPTILLTLPDNAVVAAVGPPNGKVAYQGPADELKVAEYQLGDDYSSATIDDDYAMTLQTAAKSGTPLAALAYGENQAAIFYVAANNTIQSREGLLTIPEVRSASSLSTLGLDVLPATQIAAVLYPGYTTAALFFQLPNASLASYHMNNNLWSLDAIIGVDMVEGSALAAVAYQPSGGSAVIRLYYQDASDAIKEICGDGKSVGETWAECENKSPKMPALKNTSIASVAIGTSNGGVSLRTYYHAPGQKAANLMEVYYNGTAWAGPRQVPGVELERESKICVINAANTYNEDSSSNSSGQDDEEVGVYFSVGSKLLQIFWRGGRWDTVKEFGAPAASSSTPKPSSSSVPKSSSSAPAPSSSSP